MLTVDFILALLKSIINKDYVISIIDKFLKAIIFLLGKVIYTSKD